MNRGSGTADLSVTILGSSGSYASPGNPCSGYLVRSPGAAVLLDCGPGITGPLQKIVNFDDLSAIIVTHAHFDHWIELLVLRTVYKAFRPRARRLSVHGPISTRIAYAGAVRWAGSTEDRCRMDRHSSYPFEWHTIRSRSMVTIADQDWSFAETDHQRPTLATRVDSTGRSFAFSADTGPKWDFRSLGEGIDLAMCEATHCSECKHSNKYHMTARQAARAADVAGIKRLLLTHIAPCCDPDAQKAEAGSVFVGSVEVALPGLVFTV